MGKDDNIVKEITMTVSQSSIDLKKNAKGIYQWDIKVYDDDINKAMEKSVIVDRKLHDMYSVESLI